jgi:uncharacterized protein (TIGR01244 family)
MSIMVSKHNDNFSTAGQILPEHVTAIASAGYKTIINNRPDGEGGPEQPPSSAIEAAAKAAGLAYHYLPVVSGQYTAEQIAQMAALVSGEHAAQAPIFCFCRSGARSTQLYQLALQSQED